MFKKIGRICLAAALIIVCTVALPGVATFASNLQDAKNEKNKLEERKKEVEAVLADLEGKKADIVSYIETLDAEQREIEEKMELLDSRMVNANEDLERTKADLVVAKEEVDKQYDIMKRRIKYMYENGNTGYLELFFSSDNMAEFLNQTEYMSKIAEYDAELLDRFNMATKAVAEREERIENQIAEISLMQEELELEKATNDKLSSEKALQVASYEALIEDANSEVAEYAAKIDNQNEVISKIEEEIRRKEEAERARKAAEERERAARASKVAGDKLLNGGFIWPLPSSNRITSGFGYRDEVLKGTGNNHQGIDIGAPKGDNIIAAAAGDVVAAEYHWSMGNYVLIYHGSDIYTVYMHSSKLLVSAGDHVDQGDVIALVGSTGQSTGPHLHFGIKINGSYVNPLNYVSY